MSGRTAIQDFPAEGWDRLIAAFRKASAAHCFTPAGLARIAFRTPKPSGEQQAAALDAARHLMAEAEAHHALPERAEAASWAGDRTTWRRLLDEHRNTSPAIPWGWRETTLSSGAPFIHHGYYPRRLWAFRLGPITWFEAEIVGGGLTKLRARLGRTTYQLRRQDLLDRLHTPGEAIEGREYREHTLHFTARREEALAFLERNAAVLELADATAPDVVLLGLPEAFTRADVQRAFRAAALSAHPDRGGSDAQFQELLAARDRLLAMCRQ